MAGFDGEPFLKIGVIIESFHSFGTTCRSMKLRNIKERGNFKLFLVSLKKIGGRPSGPAAELVRSFQIMFEIIFGLIVTSQIPVTVSGMRFGKLGRLPSSFVNTELKYSLSKFALSSSDMTRLPRAS